MERPVHLSPKAAPATTGLRSSSPKKAAVLKVQRPPSEQVGCCRVATRQRGRRCSLSLLNCKTGGQQRLGDVSRR